jgi:hypothetical protein
MTLQPRYPDVASDPRLTNVELEHRKLRQEITNLEWFDAPVDKSKRDKLKTLRLMMQAGKFYTPNF